MMRTVIYALTALALLGGCNSERLSSEAILIDCWGASAVGSAPGEYRIRVEAIVIPGIEGGISARTKNCPQYRLGLDYERDDIRERFNRIAYAVWPQPGLGTGIRADMTVRVKDRRTDENMTVIVTDLLSLESMNPEETEWFISEFHLG